MKGRQEVTLLNLSSPDQEIIVKIYKIFPAKAGQFGPRSTVKVADRGGRSGRIMMIPASIKSLVEGKTYVVTGLKKLSSHDGGLLFADTRGTRLTETSDEGLEWAKFGDVTVKAQIHFISDINHKEVCVDHRHEVNKCGFCPGIGIRQTTWTMSAVIMASPLDPLADGDAEDKIFIHVDGPRLFKDDMKFNDIDRIISAAMRMDEKKVSISYDNYSGKKWAVQITDIVD